MRSLRPQLPALSRSNRGASIITNFIVAQNTLLKEVKIQHFMVQHNYNNGKTKQCIINIIKIIPYRLNTYAGKVQLGEVMPSPAKHY